MVDEHEGRAAPMNKWEAACAVVAVVLITLTLAWLFRQCSSVVPEPPVETPHEDPWQRAWDALAADNWLDATRLFRQVEKHGADALQRRSAAINVRRLSTIAPLENTTWWDLGVKPDMSGGALLAAPSHDLIVWRVGFPEDYLLAAPVFFSRYEAATSSREEGFRGNAIETPVAGPEEAGMHDDPQDFGATFWGDPPVVLSPDGKFALTAQRPDINLWRVADGKQIVSGLCFTDYVGEMCFSPDGTLVVATYYFQPQGDVIGIYDHVAETGRASFYQDWGGVTGVLLNGQNDRLVILTYTGLFRLVAFTDQEYEAGAALDAARREALKGAVAPDVALGQIVGEEDDEDVLLEERGTALFVHSHCLSGEVAGAAFSPDDRLLAAWSTDGEVRLFDGRNGVPVSQGLLHAGAVMGATFSPNSRLLLTWADTGDVYVYAAESGESVLPTMPHGGDLAGAHFSADGKRIFTWGTHALRSWRVSDGRQDRPPIFLGHPINGVDFAPERPNAALLWSNGGVARVYDAITGQPLTPRLVHGESLEGALFWRHGGILTWGELGCVRRWGFKETEATFCDTGAVRTVQWLPRSRRWLLAESTGALRFLEADTHDATVFVDHDEPWVGAVASSSERLVVAWTASETVCLYGPDGEALWPPMALCSRMDRALFSPGEDEVLLWNLRGHLRFWHWRPDAHEGMWLIDSEDLDWTDSDYYDYPFLLNEGIVPDLPSRSVLVDAYNDASERFHTCAKRCRALEREGFPRDSILFRNETEPIACWEHSTAYFLNPSQQAANPRAGKAVTLDAPIEGACCDGDLVALWSHNRVHLYAHPSGQLLTHFTCRYGEVEGVDVRAVPDAMGQPTRTEILAWLKEGGALTWRLDICPERE